MVKFIAISIRNYKSYGNNTTTVVFDERAVTSITGVNNDNTANGTTSNGVGKTSLVEALVYGLYDRAIEPDTKVDSLVNNINGKNLEINVVFKQHSTEYRVERIRKGGKTGKTNSVSLFVDGVDKTFDSIAATNAEIERIVGMSFDMFVRIVVVSNSQTSFLKLPVRSASEPSQSDFIEKLFNLTVIAQRADALKADAKVVTQQLVECKARIEAAEQQVGRHNRTTESTQARISTWQADSDQQLARLEAEIAELQQVDVATDLKTHTTRSEVEATLKERQQSARELKRELATLESLLETYAVKLPKLKASMCPHCNQQYEKAAAEAKQMEIDIQETEDDVDELTRVYRGVATVVEGLLTQLEGLPKPAMSVTALHGVQASILSLTDRAAQLRVASNPLISVLEDLKTNAPDAPDYTEANALTKTAAHYDFLVKALTKKDSFVRKNLLGRTIPFLNERLQHYLDILDVKHLVKFTDEMTVDITLFGRELAYANLSSGQKARVNVALPFAFRDVMQRIVGKLNVCMVDEVLDVGLDDTGVQLAAKMIKEVAKREDTAMYVISHRNVLDGVFDKVLAIEMTGGFSNLVEK